MTRNAWSAGRRLTRARLQTAFAVVLGLCAATYVWLLVREWGDPVARFLSVWCSVSSTIGMVSFIVLARRRRGRGPVSARSGPRDDGRTLAPAS